MTQPFSLDLADYLTEESRCNKPAAYRYIWPGKNESFVCEECVPTLRKVAEILGLHLQLNPLTHNGVRCRQMKK